MNGLALDSGEFISADELNAKWLPRKATEEEMSKEQPEALPVRLAKRLCDGISIGHDWPNTDDELLRMQSAAELRRLHAENEALRAQIGQGEPLAFMSSKQLPALKDPEDEGGKYMPLRKTKLGNFDLPLYTHPAPQQKPLTDEQQIAEALRKHGFALVKTATGYDVMKLGPCIAHNIGEKK